MADLDVPAARTQLDAALHAAGTPERAAQEKRYLKSDLRHYGGSMPVINRVARAFSGAHPELTREDLRDLVEALWEPEVHELRMTAVELMTLRSGLLEPVSDLAWLETLLRTSRTWALVDPLAAEVVGPLADRARDGARALLDRWAADEDPWLRRTVLLRFLLPLRRGERAAFATFAAYAEGMLEEKELFIRKAIGWLLREYGEREPGEVAGWLEPQASPCARPAGAYRTPPARHCWPRAEPLPGEAVSGGLAFVLPSARPRPLCLVRPRPLAPPAGANEHQRQPRHDQQHRADDADQPASGHSAEHDRLEEQAEPDEQGRADRRQAGAVATLFGIVREHALQHPAESDRGRDQGPGVRPGVVASGQLLEPQDETQRRHDGARDGQGGPAASRQGSDEHEQRTGNDQGEGPQRGRDLERDELEQ